jgi:hypothetical protein
MIQKLTRLLHKVNENMENISGNEESVKFDIYFDILASGIETNEEASLICPLGKL